MKKRNIIPLCFACFLIIATFFSLISLKAKEKNTSILNAKVVNKNKDYLTVVDKNDIYYTFNVENVKQEIGTNIILEYTGVLNKNTEFQDNTIIEIKTAEVSQNLNEIPLEYIDDGIFSQYYILAYEKLNTMSLEEKIGQLFLVHYSSDAVELLEKYQFSGYIFFAKDFLNKTENEVKQMIQELQNVARIPILTAVDEEGGSVVRISSNSSLASEKFKSPSELYNIGGFNEIKKDTILKSQVLKNLGINLNLAPVVDVSTSSSDYMYDRTLKQDTKLTSIYASVVINASKNTGVSYTLKHFPGYGSNADTHTTSTVDNRSYESILKNDLPPFASGINAGAEAVLISHNIVDSIDSAMPASLSISVHNLLKNELSFSGVIISDDLTMKAVSSINSVNTKAIQAGNNLIITSDYENSLKEVKEAIDKKEVSEDLINRLAFKVIAWKYYKGLMYDNQK